MLYIRLDRLVIAGSLASALFLNTAVADNREINPTIGERWHFEVGTFSQHAGISVSNAPIGEVPDIIDLNSLGVDEEDEDIWLAAKWRLNERWHIGLSYVEVDRDGSATSEEEFDFGEPPDEVSVTIGASVASDLNVKYYILQSGYSILNSDRGNIGIGAGFHVIDFSTSISAELSAQGMTTDLGTGTAEVTAPLPNVYFFGDYAFTSRLAATANIGWFGLELNNYDGELVSFSANLEYRPWDNFGIGLGYTLININARIDETDNLIDFDVDASGPRLFFVAGFGTVR